jgi:hypothetical protein
MASPVTPQAIFGQTIEAVAGQAFAASGYTLEPAPMHQMRGLFRYRKLLDAGAYNGLYVFVEFQLLFYQGGGQSRFRINLLRCDSAEARAASTHPAQIDTTLSFLIWHGFGVTQLGGPDYWWPFSSPNELGHAIARAGQLLFGFGIPYLEGTLTPDDIKHETGEIE